MSISLTSTYKKSYRKLLSLSILVDYLKRIIVGIVDT